MSDIPYVLYQVEAVKLFVLKTINLATLVYQLFLIQTNANTTEKYVHLPNYADYLTVRLLSFARFCDMRRPTRLCTYLLMRKYAYTEVCIQTYFCTCLTAVLLLCYASLLEASK